MNCFNLASFFYIHFQLQSKSNAFRITAAELEKFACSSFVNDGSKISITPFAPIIAG